MIAAIDHVVLTTRDEQKCLAFYAGVLGMRLERYGEGRIALHFGNQKLNIHQPGVLARLKAGAPSPGSLDLCFLAAVPLGGPGASAREWGSDRRGALAAKRRARTDPIRLRARPGREPGRDRSDRRLA
jgi:catechol 2,3-dioxygenase-like lactoylglutathione lyase family enzyme